MKKILSMLLVMAMLLSMIPSVFAEEAGVMSATVEGPAPKGGEVEVTISIDSNSGFWMGTAEVCFPEELTYVSTEMTDLFGSNMNVSYTPAVEDGLVQLNWYPADMSNYTNTGVVAVITFRVSAAAGFGDSYPITIENINMADLNAAPVAFTGNGCNVTVEGSSGYLVRSTAGANGTISPLGDTEVEKGGSVEYTITADEGYHVADIQVNGIYVDFEPASEVNYTLKNINDVCTIHATFEAHTPVGDNGQCGDVVTCEICGDTLKEATEHSWDEGTETLAPTCTEPGNMHYTCTVETCSGEKDEAIEANGHDYEAVVTEPTCTEPGYTTYTCHCGDSYVADHVDATGHEHEAVVTDPTCTEVGYTTYTCHCGDSYVADEVPATGHIWDLGTVTLAPTCTEKGTMFHTCLNGCGETKTEEIAAIGHDHEAVVTDPTCTEGGYTTYTCACGDSYVADEVPATGHSWDEGTVSKAPTCTEMGTMLHACLNGCGETKTEDIEMLPHDCTETVLKEATCTETGLKAMACKNCEYTEDEAEIPVLGHKFETVVTAPTCTEVGYTTYTCHCGDSYVADEVPATGHSWDEGTVSKAPTCTEMGTMLHACLNGCGETKTEDIEMLPHDCTETVLKEATCTEPGLKTLACKNCEYTEAEVEIPALGHKLEAVVTAPTCTEAGYTTYTCAEGDLQYVDNYVEATGHSWGEGVVTTAPTCDEAGVMTYTCLNGCGETKTEDIAATGHKHESVVTAPTCTEAGYTTYTCACGDSYVTDEIPAIGHKLAETVTKVATCTEAGEKVNKCEACGQVEGEPTVIPALGHNLVAVITKPATCETKGEKVDKCKTCGHVEGNPTSIPALGHNFEDGTCSDCGEEERDNSGSGGGGGGGDVVILSDYTLTFDTNGGSSIKKLTLERGTKVDLTKYVPTRSGYIFAGWYSDKGLTRKVADTFTLNRNTTLYAKWEVAQVVEVPFKDVDNHWGKEAIDFAYINGFMAGVTGTEFGPDMALTRGMLVTILYRLEGTPAVTSANPFSDVAAGSYYAKAITWAASKGVVAGVGEGKFAPDAPLTREQLATIMFQYSALKGDANTERGSLVRFTDEQNVSSWAVEYVKWAVGSGMISGTDTGALDPQGVTTRAQCAQILYRFLTK